MNSSVNKIFDFSGFRHWITATTSRQHLISFRIAFALIWLIYDVIDVSLGQTAKILWFYRVSIDVHMLMGVQILLILCELALLLGWQAQTMAFLAFLFRGWEASFVTLNDFFYFCVVALLLSQCDCGPRRKNEPLAQNTLSWPRDLFVLQTAWIYFASALLKMNPPFLSGGDLYARQNYEAAVLPLFYPAFYRSWIGTLSGNSILAWMAVVMEISLALTLFSWLRWPRHRKKLHLLAMALALGIHGYGAYFLNVFFFGASMIAQVFFLTFSPEGT